LALPLYVEFSNGFSSRLPDELVSITDPRAMWDWDCADEIEPIPALAERFCVIGEPWEEAEVRGVVWGDSHSLHWAPFLDVLARTRNLSLVIAPTKCPPYLDESVVRAHYLRLPRFTEDCTLRNRLATEWINGEPSIRLIIMAAAWSGHIRMLYDETHTDNHVNLPISARSSEVGRLLSRPALEHALDRLDLDGRRVLLLGDIVRPNRNLNECAVLEQVPLIRKTCDQSHRNLDAGVVKAWHQASNQVLVDVAQARPEVDVLLPTDRQCDGSSCPTYVNGELLYRDSNHFRRNLLPATVAIVSRQVGLTEYFESLSIE
jgi:hypothetical protein